MDSVKEIAKENFETYKAIMELEGETDIDDFDKAYNDLIAELPEFISELREEASYASGSDDVFIYKVAYKNRSEILQRQIIVDNETITITTDTSGKEATLRITEAYKGELEGEFLYTKTSTSSGVNVKATYTEDGVEEVTITADSLNVDSVKGINVPVGTITFKIPDEEIEGTITLTASSTYNIDVTLGDSYETYVTASIVSTLSSKPDLSDYEEPSESAGDDIDGFIEDIYSSLSGSTYSGYDDYSYDYDYGDYYDYY